MVQHIRCTRQASILLALSLLVMQTYALYLTTWHVFHDMPPICQFCATVNNHENGAVSSATIFLALQSADFIETTESLPLFSLTPSLYQSRAPPSSFLIFA